MWLFLPEPDSLGPGLAITQGMSAKYKQPRAKPWLSKSAGGSEQQLHSLCNVEGWGTVTVRVRKHQFNPQQSKVSLCLALTAPQAGNPQPCGATESCSGWNLLALYVQITFNSLLYPFETSELELQPQNKPLTCHKLITCSMRAKGVERNVPVPLLLMLGKLFLQC